MFIKISNSEGEDSVSPFIGAPPPHLDKNGGVAGTSSQEYIYGEDMTEDKRLCRKRKWRIMVAKAAAKGRLGGGGYNIIEEKKGIRKTPLRQSSRVTEEDTSLGSVLL